MTGMGEGGSEVEAVPYKYCYSLQPRSNSHVSTSLRWKLAADDRVSHYCSLQQLVNQWSRKAKSQQPI